MRWYKRLIGSLRDDDETQDELTESGKKIFYYPGNESLKIIRTTSFN